MPGKLNLTLDEVLYDVTATNIEFSATVAVLRLNERLHENMAFNLINCRLKARSHGIVKKFLQLLNRLRLERGPESMKYG